MNQNIRNIAIIAHVDHGKTTLVDQLMKEGGVYRANQHVEERAMDSMDLEREKGITIKAKNTAVHWHDKTINIVDTPGHADFGGEVERALRMVDGVLLVVDAYDGPQAQTRFVLRKALQHGLKVVIVINKIDRENAEPRKAHDKVLELLLELNASEEQFDAPVVYGSGRDGYMMSSLDGERKNMDSLFEAILEHVPPPFAKPGAPFHMLVSNIDWSDYVGRIAVGKILGGQVAIGDTVWVIRNSDGKRTRAKITKVFEFSGLQTNESPIGIAGMIVGVSGFEDIDIGDTIATGEDAHALPFTQIDPPTLEMTFCINDGPLAGREGKYVTSRQLRDRLYREIKTNVSIKVEDTDKAGVFNLKARGAMQIAVLVETMRREGFEILVSRPQVITQKDAKGHVLEPYETLWVELPEECVGVVMQNLANRKGQLTNLEKHPHGTTLEATITTRGLIGFEIDLVNATNGRGVMSHLFKEYGPWAGDLITRLTGTILATEAGITTAYALDFVSERGRLFVGPGEDVYEGMIVGENPRKEDVPVNAARAKQLTNFRSQGEGKGIQLSPPVKMSLERAIEYIAPDEYVEVTPKSLRLRKKILSQLERRKVERAERSAQEKS
ncbi:MAG: translational GTPase TypA [Opitutaceae bacterium]|jgi:GTP-binding protein